jgi:hypothetical protein
VPLSSAEKQRRYRERKRAEQEARERYDRGLPEPPPPPEPPDGAFFHDPDESDPKPITKFGHYEAADGTFPPIPEGMWAETITTADGDVKRLEEYQMKVLARHREASMSDDRSILFEG